MEAGQTPHSVAFQSWKNKNSSLHAVKLYCTLTLPVLSITDQQQTAVITTLQQRASAGSLVGRMLPSDCCSVSNKTRPTGCKCYFRSHLRTPSQANMRTRTSHYRLVIFILLQKILIILRSTSLWAVIPFCFQASLLCSLLPAWTL